MPENFITPDWVHHAVFYQIFPDRFASSPAVSKPTNLEPWDAPPTPYGFKGGDLLGVYDHLDYLQDLGITALYFTPIFQSASNHRYHTHDYLRVDPLLGGDEAFQTLLKEAHRRGMRIVLDGVFNHASRGFFQFNHILEVGRQSPYLDWFKVKGYPLRAYDGRPNYDCWWNLAALPTLNHANPQVKEFIFQVARYWIDQGIDGWRLDVPFEVKEEGFWQEFRQVVKSANPQAYITGEIPWDATPWLQGDQFDGVMNYLMTYPCWSFFSGSKLQENLVGHWRGHGAELFVKDAPGFANAVTQLLSRYPRPAVLAQLNLLDSHDTSRFLSIAGENKAALRLATLFQMTYPGAPCVYYANEIGMTGGKDPDCRRSFPWDEARWDQDLRSYFKRCIALHKAHPALREGEWRVLAAEKGAVVFLRSLDDDHVVVVLNNSQNTYHLDAAVENLLPEGLVMSDHFGAGSARISSAHLSGLSVATYSGAAFVS